MVDVFKIQPVVREVPAPERAVTPLSRWTVDVVKAKDVKKGARIASKIADVVDSQGMPIEGLVFRVRIKGPKKFRRDFQIVTDRKGDARIDAVRWDGDAGEYDVRISAQLNNGRTESHVFKVNVKP